jgi:hypothetical protein
MENIGIFLFVIVILALIWDTVQTLKIQLHTNIYETNPIIGPHPNNATVFIYFTIWIMGIIVAFLYFSKDINLMLDSIVLAVEAYAIRGNIKLGL